MAKSPDAFRTISEVSEWLDTKPHVLRFWESKFKEISPVKRAGGRRYYRPDDMRLIGGIKKLLHDDGMTIKGVQKMLAAQGVDDVAALSQPLDFTAGAGDNATVRAVASDDSAPDSRSFDTASTDTLPPSTSDDDMVQDQTAAEAGDADTLAGDGKSDGAVPKVDQVEDDQLAAEMDDTADDAPAAAPTSDDVPSDGPKGPDAAPTADSEDAAQEIVADASDAIPDDATPDAAPESTVVQLDTGAEDDDLGEEPLLFPEIGDEEFWEDAAAADSEDKVIHLTPRVTQIDRPAAEPSVFAPLPAQRPAAPVATLYTMTPDQRAALAADHQTAIVGLIQWAQRRVAGA